MARVAAKIVLAVCLAVGAAACSDSTAAGGERRAEPTAIAAPAATGADGQPLTLSVVDGGERTGLVATDHRGFAVYGVAGETTGDLVCVDECLQTWLPVAPRDAGVEAPLDPADYETFMRPDGVEQVAYQGIPLYSWSGDSQVGITGGAGVAGIWFAITETAGFIEPG